MSSFTTLFPETIDALLASRIARYFSAQVFRNKGPIGIDDSLVGYFKHDWQELVNKGEVPLSRVSDTNVRVYPFDVEKRLPIYIGRLVQAGYLIKKDQKYLPGEAIN